MVGWRLAEIKRVRRSGNAEEQWEFAVVGRVRRRAREGVERRKGVAEPRRRRLEARPSVAMTAAVKQRIGGESLCGGGAAVDREG